MVVFDVEAAFSLLAKPHGFNYLVLLLVSFIKVGTFTLNMANEHGRTHLLRCDTLDLNSLIQEVVLVTEPEWFSAYQRVVDFCLFTIGVFPERIWAVGSRSVAFVRAEWIEKRDAVL